MNYEEYQRLAKQYGSEKDAAETLAKSDAKFNDRWTSYLDEFSEKGDFFVDKTAGRVVNNYFGRSNIQASAKNNTVNRAAMQGAQKSPQRGLLDPITVEEAGEMGIPERAGGFGKNILKSGGRLAVDVTKGLSKLALGLGVKGVEAVSPLEFDDPLGSETVVESVGKAAIGGAKNTAETLAAPFAKAINYATGTELDAENIFNDPETEEVASAIGDYFADRTGVIDFFRAAGSIAQGDIEGMQLNLESALNKASTTAFEDPVGLMADIMTVGALGGGVLKGTGKIGELSTRLATAGAESVPLGSAAARVGSAASKVAKVGKETLTSSLALDPAFRIMQAEGKIVGHSAKLLKKGVATSAKFGWKQVTGFSDDTTSYIIKNARKFDPNTDIEVTRTGIGDQFQNVLSQYESAQSGVLPEYKTIRQASQAVKFTKNPIIKLLEKKGFTIETAKDGTVSIAKTKNTAIPLTKAEISQMEDVLKLIGKDQLLTANQFLNIRGELTKLSKFDVSGARTSDLNDLARQARKSWNETYRGKFKGLEDADGRFADVSGDIEELAEGFARMKDGKLALTESGYKRLLNLTNRGNERLLAKVNKFIPDIEEQVNMLRALEDVQVAGNKVGFYVRGALIGGSAAAAFTHPAALVPAMMAFMLGNPRVAVFMLDAYGTITGASKDFVKGIVNRMKKGLKLTPEEKAYISRSFEHFIKQEEGVKRSLGTESRLQPSN